MKPLRLIVGLGNPGSEYADTRHNIGFWFVDRLAAELKVPLASQGKFFGQVGKVGGSGELWLLKPSTFMNRSGQSVVALANYYKILPDEILVVHDELDLQPGSLRVKCGGGSGGHNGLKDVHAALSTPDFWRLRVGIGHPGDRNEVINYVLKAPRKEEERLIDEALDRSLACWPKFAAGDYESAQRVLHSKAA